MSQLSLLGSSQTREMVIDNYLYSTTKMSRQLLVLDIELFHTLEAKTIEIINIFKPELGN